MLKQIILSPKQQKKMKKIKIHYISSIQNHDMILINIINQIMIIQNHIGTRIMKMKMRNKYRRRLMNKINLNQLSHKKINLIIQSNYQKIIILIFTNNNYSKKKQNYHKYSNKNMRNKLKYTKMLYLKIFSLKRSIIKNTIYILNFKKYNLKFYAIKIFFKIIFIWKLILKM